MISYSSLEFLLSQQFLWESAARITFQRDERLSLKVNGPSSRDFLELILRSNFVHLNFIFRVQNPLLSQIIQSYASVPFSLIKKVHFQFFGTSRLLGHTQNHES